MSKEHLHTPHEFLHLPAIDLSFREVQAHWNAIDDELEKRGIGRKDIPFDDTIRERMMTAYEHINDLLAARIQPFSAQSIPHILEFNHLVLYGRDMKLRNEYSKAIDATEERFMSYIRPIAKWYRKHERKSSTHKLSSEMYVSFLGGQIFTEGNHRTAATVASWVNAYWERGIFVLSMQNAINYFAPSAGIKEFGVRSLWREHDELPKYKKQFGQFWKKNIDAKYLTKK